MLTNTIFQISYFLSERYKGGEGEGFEILNKC